MINGPVEIDALRYLHEPTDGFWSWTDDGGAVQWFGGGTIVFTAELLAILRHQHASGARGLPPLGAIILLVAATRENWAHATTDVNKLKRNWIRILDDANATEVSQYKTVLNGLDKIHALDGDVRLSLEAKQWIAEFVFSRSIRTPVGTSTEVLRILGGFEETFWNYRHLFADRAEESLRESIYVLHDYLEGVTAEKLRLLRETGIEELPVVPEKQELEFPEHDSIKSLVSDLHSDKDMFGIARATQHLMSVMSLPRPMLRDDQMEQGGFSDIANRGSLDRLLLSELAYDDLTLAVRVAVNEAMYLRREIPPSESQRRRVFLLDSGLRMWGVPRFLGMSVALALAGQLQSEADQGFQPFTTYAASGQDLQEIDLSQRKGIAAHLKTLRPELDSSGSLSALEESLEDFEESPEVVVITSPEALRDVGFRDRIAAMGRQNAGSYFVVTVARDGDTRLNEITRSGCKLLQQLKFDLDRVFSNPPISKAKPKSELPAIFGLKQFPLLLPYQYEYKRIWPLGSKMMLAISNDSRLMLSTGSKNGGFQLLPKVKRATYWWFSREPIDSIWFSIVGTGQTKKDRQFRLLAFNQEDLSVEEIELVLPEPPIGFCSHRDTIFSVGESFISIIDKSTGMTSLNQLAIAGETRLTGRYFAIEQFGNRRLYALASDGLSPKFELLPNGSVNPRDCRPFDSTEVEGPVGVSDSGHLYFWATDKLIEMQHGLGERVSVSDICHTGNAIILRGHESKQRVKIDVKTGMRLKPPGVLTNFLPLQIQKLVSQKSLRTKLQSIAIYDSEILSLSSRKQPRIDIVLTKDRVRLLPTTENGNLHSRIDFQSESIALPARFKFKVARWSDGSEAWLDSRGLLHLKSSQQEIPELTMVLTDDAMGGWLSNGRVWGDSYFLQKSSPVHATNEYVLNVIKNFTTNITSRC